MALTLPGPPASCLGEYLKNICIYFSYLYYYIDILLYRDFDIMRAKSKRNKKNLNSQLLNS